MREAAIIFRGSDHKIDQWMQTLWFKGFSIPYYMYLCFVSFLQWLGFDKSPNLSGCNKLKSSECITAGDRIVIHNSLCLSSIMHAFMSCWYLSIPILQIVARGQLCVVICSACLEFSLNQTNSVCILFDEWNYMLWLWIFMCLGLLACPEFNVDKTIKALDTIRLRLQDKGSIYSWRPDPLN